MQEKAKREKKPIVISENRSFEGIWIPRKLYITNKFNPRVKFFIVEVKSLSKYGYCYATDKHFSDFLGISERMVQKIIKELKDQGYINTKYEYEEDTNAIKRRFIILTKKFYEEFYNEEGNDGTEQNFDTPTEQNFSTPTEKKFDTGTELKYGEKYNNNSSNTKDSSITDSSIPEKEHTVSKDTAKVHTVVSGRNNVMREKPIEKYLSLKDKETDMLKRVLKISLRDYDEETAKEIFLTIEHFLMRYTQMTGKIHPILTDETLELVIDAIANFEDCEYGHFEKVIKESGTFREIIDEYFNTDFGAINGGETNYRLPHFVSDEILSRIAQRVVEY